MSEHAPKRYNPMVDNGTAPVPMAVMNECFDGDYVSFEDYDQLRDINTSLLAVLRTLVANVEDAGWHPSCTAEAQEVINEAEGYNDA